MPQETRTAIIRATICLFNEYGPMVPMSKISEAAGVAAGTPFRYFKTKEELVHAAYVYAKDSTMNVIPQEDHSGMDTEQLIKSIVRRILYWASVCPQEHQYMRKYEDSVCYDCFSDRFSQELYEGIIAELGIWERIRNDVREDLPQEVISRLISFNCSVYSRYLLHEHLEPGTPAYEAMLEASADSIWNSIRRMP